MTAGTSQPKCVIHCRVSTIRQAAEGESPEAQAAICLGIASAKGWAVACPPWKEAYSGRKDVRPVFEDILSYLAEHRGEVQYYLFRSIDRFTRAGSYAYEEMKRSLNALGVELIDTLGVIQPKVNTLDDLGIEYEWSRIAPSEIAELVAATTAKHEVSTILTRLIGAQIRLVRRGYKVGQALDGYTNAKVFIDGKKRTIQREDTSRSSYIIAMYELRASGQYTDKEICDRINAMGYRSKPFRRWDTERANVIAMTRSRPLIPKALQRIVQRTQYCGVNYGKWTGGKAIPTAYPALVSIDLFNRANRGKVFIQEGPSGSLELLFDCKPERVRRRYSRNDAQFPYRHVVLCPACRKPLVGSSPRGKSGRHFPTYHCGRKHKYFGLAKDKLEAALFARIGAITFQPAAIESTIDALRMTFSLRAQEVAAQAQAATKTAAALEERLDELADAFARASTDEMRKRLEAQLISAKQQAEEARPIAAQEVQPADFDGFVADIRTVMEHPALLLKTPVLPDEMRALYSLVFKELPSAQDLTDGTPELRWVFYVSSSLCVAKSQLAGKEVLDWNSLQGEILAWKKIAPLLNNILRSPRSLPSPLKS